MYAEHNPVENTLELYMLPIYHVTWCTFSQFSSVTQFCPTPWIAACQGLLSITNSGSLIKLMSIESVMPSSHLIFCHPLLLLPPTPPSIRVFSNESTLRIRSPKYWTFSFSISPSNEHSDWSPLEWTGWISLQSKGLSKVFPKTTVQKHQFFSDQFSKWIEYLSRTGSLVWLNFNLSLTQLFLLIWFSFTINRMPRV